MKKYRLNLIILVLFPLAAGCSKDQENTILIFKSNEVVELQKQ